jgi:hypothetical protein
MIKVGLLASEYTHYNYVDFRYDLEFMCLNYIVKLYVF